jgi:hypothetical protein
VAKFSLKDIPDCLLILRHTILLLNSYNEVAVENIFLINLESSKISNETFGENGYDHALRCRVCGDRFIFKEEETIFSKWIDHIKSHYIDEDLVKKEWIAKHLIHLNYDSVI